MLVENHLMYLFLVLGILGIFLLVDIYPVTVLTLGLLKDDPACCNPGPDYPKY